MMEFTPTGASYGDGHRTYKRKFLVATLSDISELPKVGDPYRNGALLDMAAVCTHIEPPVQFPAGYLYVCVYTTKPELECDAPIYRGTL